MHFLNATTSSVNYPPLVLLYMSTLLRYIQMLSLHDSDTCASGIPQMSNPPKIELQLSPD